MSLELLKQKLKIILGEQIIFNKEFEEVAVHIKNFEENIIPWCELIKQGKIRAAPSSYLDGSIVFIKKIGSSNRCIIIKIKNGVFCEIHLADHKYYDEMRKELGLKESSYIVNCANIVANLIAIYLLDNCV